MVLKTSEGESYCKNVQKRGKNLREGCSVEKKVAQVFFGGFKTDSCKSGVYFQAT